MVIEAERSGQPEYYYDISIKKVLFIGRVGIKGFGKYDDYLGDLMEHGKIEAVDPAAELVDRRVDGENVVPLNELLDADNLPMPSRAELFDISHWELNHYINYAVFLNDLTNHLRSSIFRNARVLGIGASPKQINNNPEIRSLSKLYTLAELKGVKRNAVFRDWSRRDFINYIKSVAKKLGRRPHVRELNKIAKDNPNCPSPEVIAPRFGRTHGLGQLMELAGFMDTRSWQKEDYISWGVRFMKANNGRVPTAPQLDYLCSQQHGPSRHSVRRKFTKISIYQQAVSELYSLQVEAEISAYNRLRQEMEDRISQDTLPLLLFRSVCEAGITEEALNHAQQMNYKEIEHEIPQKEKLIRYAKYTVLEELPTKGAQAHTFVKASITGLQARSFEGSARHINDAISPADVEETASYLGVFDYIWPMDEYMETLKIPDNMLNEAA